MASGSRQQGFTYLYALLFVGLSGALLVSFAGVWSQAREREKRAELRWVGNQFRQAIGVYYERSPGAVKRYPEGLEELLEDKRFITVQRYLRRIYPDPTTGKTDWKLVTAPGGGIMGLQSSSASDASNTFVYEPSIVRAGLVPR